jgi:hypothetical protein
VATREEILKEIADLRKQKAEQLKIQTDQVTSFFGSRKKLNEAADKEAEIQKKIYAKYDELKALNSPPSASGQTAEQKVANDATTSNPGTGTPDKTQDPQPVTAEQKDKLDQSKSGELSTKVNQASDPTAGATTGTAKTNSESYYTEPSAANQADSVQGKDVSGNKSDFNPSPKTTGVGIAPRNKLHDYTNYTYRITLFLLTARDFNLLAANPSKFEPTFSLISSAGGYATPSTRKLVEDGYGGSYIDTPGRHRDFQTDFFIDNLQLTTTTGLNAKTKASNAVNISFTVTEPYGLSLLDRLLSACETTEDANPNYMAQPYLLQIDILANPTDGKLSQLNQTNNLIDRKRIAIKLTEMKIKPSGSGTTYNIQAIPFHHTAFSMTVASVPIPMNIEAGTVGDFFGGKEEIAKLFGQLKADENRVESELKKYVDEVWSTGGIPPTAAEIESRRNALKNAIVYSSKNFTAAYNVYMESIATAQQLSTKPPVKIAFNIPNPEIAESKIVDELAQNSDSTMADQKNGAVAGQSNDNLRVTQSFNIHRGLSIIEVIDQVMGKSDYVKNQLNTQGKQNNTDQANNEYTNGGERTDDKQKPKKVDWYKIVPTVALSDFDYARNNYSKTILYSILPYTVVNAYHPNFPKGAAQNVADRVVRVYDYLYTGKNQDILRLDIDFDSTYYTQITSFRNQVARQGQSAYNNPQDAGGFKDNEFATNATSGNVRQTSNPPVSTEITGSNASSNSMNTATNPKEQIVADFKSSIYTRSRGDALNIKLQILGDPAFIKQDDIYYNPGGNVDEYGKFIQDRLEGYSTAPITKTGQILFDAEQVFVRVNFKNAVDINDSIGIVNKQDKLSNGRTTDGTFSGVYKVQIVTSEFSRGQFTQTLDLVRFPEELPKAAKPVDEQKQTDTSVKEQTQNYGSLNAQQLSPLQPSPVADNPRPPDPDLVTASTQPAEGSPVPNSGDGNPQAKTSTNSYPPQNANDAQKVAPQNTAGWTFSDAFRQARKDFGNRPGGVFEYRGKLYQTNYQNEPFVANPKPVYPGANQ